MKKFICFNLIYVQILYFQSKKNIFSFQQTLAIDVAENIYFIRLTPLILILPLNKSENKESLLLKLNWVMKNKLK